MSRSVTAAFFIVLPPSLHPSTPETQKGMNAAFFAPLSASSHLAREGTWGRPPCFALRRTHARTCRESPKTAPFTLKIIPLELAALQRRKETDYDLLRHLRTTYAKSHSNREKYRALAPFHSTCAAATAGGEKYLFFIWLCPTPPIRPLPLLSLSSSLASLPSCMHARNATF